jgi:dTDP-L-rhamnose 4-epimerase
MRVLVTGGAGFIGGHLVDRFLRDGFEVRVLDNLDPKIHPQGLPTYFPREAEFIRGDVTDEIALLRALRGVDIVSHQAAYQDYMPDFSRFMQVNVVSTALLFELIVREQLPVQKVIVASSQAVYGEGQHECPEHGFFLPQPRTRQQLSKREWEVLCPTCGKVAEPMLLPEESSNPFNQYAVSKLAQEKTALGLGYLHGIPTVALRYSITQGPRQSLHNHYSGICRIFVSRALAGLPLIIYEDGKQTRDFIHIDDVIDANSLVLSDDRANFQAYNVGGGRSTTVLEFASEMSEVMGLDCELSVSGEFRLGDNRHSVSKINKLSALGWKPSRNLREIIAGFSDWVQSSGGVPAGIPDAYRNMKDVGVVLPAAS